MDINPNLTFKLSGNQFNQGYNLYYLNKGLNNFHTLIDKAYLTIEDKTKMTDRDREILQIKATNIREGSFEADLAIQLSTISTALVPIVTSLSPMDVWSLVKDSYEYLKVVLEANSRGEKYELNAENSTVNVVNGDGATIIQIHPDVLRNVHKSERNFENLARMIDPSKGVESVNILDQSTREKQISIGVEEKMYFENKKRLEPEPVTFHGIITKVDSETFYGKLQVLEGNENITQGEYSFEFFDKEDVSILRDVFLTPKKIIALKEVILNPATLTFKTLKLKIITVK